MMIRPSIPGRPPGWRRPGGSDRRRWRPSAPANSSGTTLQDRDIQGGKVSDVPAVIRAARPAVAGWLPAASTVTTRASDLPSSSSRSGSGLRSDVQYTRSGRPPACARSPSTARRRRRCYRPGAGRGSTAPRSSGGSGRRNPRSQRSGDPALPTTGHRRREAESRHQQGVAEEGVELAEIRYAAGSQVGVGLQGDTGRHRGALHQIGVGACSPLTTTTGSPLPTGVDPVLPGPVSAEDAHHDDVGAGQQAGQFPSTSRDGLARRKFPPLRAR